MLLTREDFREMVLKRDNYKCIIPGCNKEPLEVHHIIDRSLFEDGGYYLDNGVTLCGYHHLQAEQTCYTAKLIREHAKIENIILPPHFDKNEEYDKWGNTILPSGMKLKGELYYEPNVQKIMGNYASLLYFLKYIKFPRTYHFPDSPNLQNDDRMHQSLEQFEGKEVVGTIKMDGENTSCYSDYIHARSIDSKDHDSRHWIKSYHATFKYEIPENWVFCGENLFAKHSIYYHNLKNYFYLFAIMNEKNVYLSWNELVEWCELLNLTHVPVFYKGIYDRNKIHEAFENYVKTSEDEIEGYVIRVSNSFHYNDYKRLVAKYVRANHVQTSKFWMSENIIPNKLKG